MLIMYLLMQLMCFSSFNNAILTRCDLKSGKTYILENMATFQLFWTGEQYFSWELTLFH